MGTKTAWMAGAAAGAIAAAGFAHAGEAVTFGTVVSGAALTARACSSDDADGNRISETGPGAALTSCP